MPDEITHQARTPLAWAGQVLLYGLFALVVGVFSRWPPYRHLDADKALITITGNVTTSQGKNVIKGDKLVINLETGESSFDVDPGKAAQGAKQRIKMLIDPNEVPRTTN